MFTLRLWISIELTLHHSPLASPIRTAQHSTAQHIVCQYFTYTALHSTAQSMPIFHTHTALHCTTQHRVCQYFTYAVLHNTTQHSDSHLYSSFRPPAPVIVLGATNRPMDIDAAFLRRMPLTVQTRAPDFPSRVDILTKMLQVGEGRGGKWRCYDGAARSYTWPVLTSALCVLFFCYSL